MPLHQADNRYPDTNWSAQAVHHYSLNFQCQLEPKQTNKQETQAQCSKQIHLRNVKNRIMDNSEIQAPENI